MNRQDKKKLREETLEFYRAFSHSLYKRWCVGNRYTSNEIRHEILKILIDHVMKRTTKALHQKTHRKRSRGKQTPSRASQDIDVQPLDFDFEEDQVDLADMQEI